MSAQSSQPPASAPTDARLAELVDELTARLKPGEAVDLDAFIRQHPEHAAELERLLPALRLLAELSESASRQESEALAVSGVLAPELGVLGDFRIVREIGKGGMGLVYEAVQISLKRRVALKVLPFAATMDSRQLQRFHNEAQAAANLHHTNIVPVYYIGSHRGVHYYAMQYIEGRDLAGVINQLREQSGRKMSDSRQLATVDAANGAAVTRSATPVSTKSFAGLSTERSTKPLEHFRTVAQLSIQAAEALDHAHQMGIVHRDVKPANLLVDGIGRLWITDFGLAQFQSDTRLTMTGDLVGTLRYMSPEQALAKRVIVDHRTDIYSLGATLYELLTLEPAFDGRDRQELLRQIAFDEPIRPRRLNKGIPAELETIVLKALEKNPQERYETAQQLADDLRNWLEDRPIQARRPGLLARAQKWSRRHKSLVRALGLGLVVAVVALAVSTVWAWHKEKQTEDARQYADGQRATAEKNAGEADRQRQRADQNFRKTLTLVTNLLNESVDHRRGYNPATYQHRVRLANEAVPLIQELLSEENLTQQDALLLAQVYEALAAAQTIRGEFVEVARAILRKRDLYAQLAAKFPAETAYKQEVTRLENNLKHLRPYNVAADSAEIGLHEVAANAFRDGLRIEQVLGPEFNVKIPQVERAYCGVRQADELRALGRCPEAEKACGDALAACDLVAGDPTVKAYPPFVTALKARARACRGFLRVESGRLREAEDDLCQALDLVDQLKPEEREVVALGVLHDWARVRSALGNVLWAAGRLPEATAIFRAAEQEWRKAPSDAVRDNDLAWFLATCPDTQFRNAKEAVALAQQAVKGIPETEPWRVMGVIDRSPSDSRRTLGVALYRAGDWKEASKTFVKAMQLRRQDGGPPGYSDPFFLAMTEWQLGNKKGARKLYDEGVKSMTEERPKDAELLRLRAEADQLLGIEDKKD